MRRLPTHELLNWADQVGFSIDRNLSDYRKGADIANLEEARLGISGLEAVVDELIARGV